VKIDKVQVLSEYVRVEHWHLSKERDLLVLRRTVSYPDGRLVFLLASVPKELNKICPPQKGVTRLKLSGHISLITPVDRIGVNTVVTSRTFLQVMEILDSRKPIPINLPPEVSGSKARKLFTKISTLIGLVKVEGTRKLLKEAAQERHRVEMEELYSLSAL